jgi:hypothetical protein
MVGDTTMQRVTSLPASSVSPEELNVILAEYLALDRARIVRRLFVVRFGLLASASAIVALIVPGLSAIARWLPPLLFVTPALWAWIVELRRARRLARRLEDVDGAATDELRHGLHKKVVKSS